MQAHNPSTATCCSIARANTVVAEQGGIFHDGSERAEALDTCISTWSVLSQNFSRDHAKVDQARMQAAAPIFAGIFQAFVDALLQHAQVGGGGGGVGGLRFDMCAIQYRI
jgi:hypothetical protein